MTSPNATAFCVAQLLMLHLRGPCLNLILHPRPVRLPPSSCQTPLGATWPGSARRGRGGLQRPALEHYPSGLTSLQERREGGLSTDDLLYHEIPGGIHHQRSKERLKVGGIKRKKKVFLQRLWSFIEGWWPSYRNHQLPQLSNTLELSGTCYSLIGMFNIEVTVATLALCTICSTWNME